MKSTPVLIALLLSAVLAIDLVVVVMDHIAMDRATDEDFPHPVVFIFLLIALSCTQVGVLAGHLVFGPAHVLLRMAILATGIIAWQWPMAQKFPHEAGTWNFFFLLVAVMVAGPLLIARAFGVQLHHQGTPVTRAGSRWKKSGATAGLPSSDSPGRRGTAGQASSGTHSSKESHFQQAAGRAFEPAAWQFSLRWIMLWTAVVAVLLTARQLVSVPMEDLREVVFLTVSNAVVTLSAIWCVLGNRRLRVAVILAATIGIAIASCLNPWPLGVDEVAMPAVDFLLAAGMLAVLRVAGFRLVRVPKEPEERVIISQDGDHPPRDLATPRGA